MGKPEGRPGHRWEYNVKVKLSVVWNKMDWIYLAKDRGKWWLLVNSIINRGVSHSAGNFLSNEEMLSSLEGLGSKALFVKIY